MPDKILFEIAAERSRQDKIWGEQNHVIIEEDKPYSFWQDNANSRREKCDKGFKEGKGSWRLILNEEVAEAYEQAALGDNAKLREELIQVAAVVVAMIECLDRTTGVANTKFDGTTDQGTGSARDQ